jgi:hypothetical protein
VKNCENAYKTYHSGLGQYVENLWKTAPSVEKLVNPDNFHPDSHARTSEA